MWCVDIFRCEKNFRVRILWPKRKHSSSKKQWATTFKMSFSWLPVPERYVGNKLRWVVFVTALIEMPWCGMYSALRNSKMLFLKKNNKKFNSPSWSSPISTGFNAFSLFRLGPNSVRHEKRTLFHSRLPDKKQPNPGQLKPPFNF